MCYGTNGAEEEKGTRAQQIILEKVNEVEKTAVKVCTKLDAMDKGFSAMLTKIDKAIYGNGKPGLVARMAVLETKVLGKAREEEEEHRQEFEKNMMRRRALLGVGIAVAGFLLGGLVEWIRSGGLG